MKYVSGLGLMVMLAGCGDDSGAATGTDTDAATTSTTDDAVETTEDPSAGTTTDPTTDPSGPDPTSGNDTGAVLPECGNDVLEPPEECDDGNLDPGDGCEADCTVSVDTQIWAQTHGGDASIQDTAYGVAFDAAGNVWVVGYEVDTVADGNIWVHGYAPDGTPGMEFTLDPSAGGEDRGFAIDVDAMGNLYVAGRAATDAWFAKLGPDGSELWSRTASGSSEGADQANAIAVGPTGAVLVGGFLRQGNGDNDLWVTQVSGDDGSEQWAEVVDGGDSLEDRIEGVAWTADGDPVAAGFVSNEGFNSDVWVRRYGTDGSETWTQRYETKPPRNQQALSLAVAPDGTVGIAGTTPSTVNDDDVFFAKFDPSSGDVVQLKSFGSPAVLDDAGLALAADSESAYIVVGYKAVTSTDTDIWMRKWDAIGNVVWTQNASGAGMGDDAAWGVAIDDMGDIAVVGEIRNRPNTNGDVWVAKYGGDPG
jgi:cysteine-rich repeat protein